MGKTGTRRRFIYAIIVVTLAVSAILAAINFQSSCMETGIIPVGEVQVNGTTPVWDLIGDVGSFESPDGHIYLLIAGHSDGIMVVNVTNPYVPVQTGNSIPYGSLGESWRIDTEVFKSPDGRIYALLTGKGAMILDVTDPQNPVPINNTLNSSGVLDDAFDATIFESPDGSTYAWVKGSTHGVRILDVTDPHHPALIVDRGGNIFGHDIGAIFEPPDGRTYAMSSNIFLGLYIEDVTDPHNPVPVTTMRYAGDSTGPYQQTAAAFPELPVIFIPGEHAAGLYHARNIVTFEPPDGRIYAMIANNGITSHINGTQTRTIPTGILFMDVTDPHAPVPTYDIRNGDDGFDIGSHIRYIEIFEASDGHTYAAIAGRMGVLIMDVTDPHAPVPTSEIQDGEDGFHAVGAVSGMTVFESPDGIIHLAAVSGEGVEIADITSPHRPVPVGTAWDDQRGIFALGRAYYHTVFEPGDGHTYALGTGNDGVHFVDVTVPHAPIPVGSIWDGRDGFDTLERAGQTALLESTDGRSYALVGSSEGVQIADVTDPHNPRPAGSLRDGLESVWITGIAILKPADDRAYALIAEHGAGIHVVDVTDPSTPVLAGGMLAGDNFDILGGVHGVAVYGQSDKHNYALVASDFGMHTVDVANPLDPVLAGVVQGSMGNRTSTEFYHPFPIESPEGRTYALIDSGNGVRILDITDPYDPVSTGSIPVGDDIFALHSVMPMTTALSYDDHGYALIGSGSGIQILDITDPYDPLLLNSTLADEVDFSLDENSWYDITFPKYITLFEADDGHTYALVGSDNGMRILDVTKPYVPASVGKAEGVSNACQ